MPNWSQGAQGAMGGAAAGGAIGGPAGAVIGGALGGLGGMFGGSSAPQLPGYAQRNRQLQDGIAGAQGRQVMGANIGMNERSAGGQDFRTGQMDLVRQLRAQAAGKGPSLAGLQAQQVAQQSLAQQQALAASAAPGNEALAARQAAMNAGGTMANLAQTSAQARMAEQMAAQSMLGGVLGQGRGQDTQNEQFNAGQFNQRNLEQARMQQQNSQFNAGRNDAYELSLRGLDLQNAGAQMGGQAPNTFGTQMMSGGANVLAMYGMGQLNRGGGGAPPVANNAGLDMNSLNQSYGYGPYTRNGGGV